MAAMYSAIIAMVTMYTVVRAGIVDLSHVHGKDTIMSPDNPQYKAKTIFDGKIMPGVYAKFSSYGLGEHGGTHLDAPRHFHKTGHSLEKVPIENTIAEGVMIDCSKEVAKSSNYALTVDKLKSWEEEHGKIPQQAAVVVNFNWSHKFENIREYFNTQELNNQETYKFPYISQEAIDWLVEKRDINILAIDSPSPDLLFGKFPVHVKMLTSNKLIVENINDPGRLPPKGFTFHATPVKFVGATGVQVRAFAHTQDDDRNDSHAQAVASLVLVISMALFSRFTS